MPELVAPSDASAPDQTTVEQGRGGSLNRVKRVLFPAVRLLVAAAIVAAVAWTTVNEWSQVRHTFSTLAWESVVLALLAAVAGIGAGMMSWRSALHDLGHEVPVLTAGRINLVGQLGKYVPGSVWAYVLQMELGRRAGLPRARAFLASVVSVGLGVTAGLVVGILGLPALFDAARGPDASTGRFALYVLVGLVPVALVCAHPRVLTRLVNLFLRVLRRQPLGHDLSWRGVLRTIGWAAVAYACFGLHLWLLANAQAAPGVGGIVRSVGAMALAMTVSVFAVVAPSGLGVREGILTAALTPYLGSPGLAFSVALVSRLIFTVADVIAAGGAALSGVRYLKHTQPAHVQPTTEE
ncbi:MAG TPA: lysylphosphatidylglycerol synthase transmembrane domain-containing protein [Micromonosporaceae bacterium]